MFDTEYLYTMAQVAVAFVGFSAIVTALRASNDELGEMERGYMSALVERSLAVLGFSLMPALVVELGFSDEQVIFFCSMTLGAYMLLTMARSIAYHYSHPLIVAISSFWVRAIIGGVIGCLQIANALGFNHGYPVGVYLGGVSLVLLAAGLAFVAMLQTEPGSGFEKDERRLNIFGKQLDPPEEAGSDGDD